MDARTAKRLAKYLKIAKSAERQKAKDIVAGIVAGWLATEPDAYLKVAELLVAAEPLPPE